MTDSTIPTTHNAAPRRARGKPVAGTTPGAGPQFGERDAPAGEELGPDAWANWQTTGSADGGDTWEFAWYSDSRFSGEIRGLGPYAVLNTVPIDTTRLAMALVLRAESRGPASPTLAADDDRWSKTDASRYHGGDLDEELAALVSLALGVRCRTGGSVRMFRDDDVKGNPFEFDHHPPYLPPARRGSVVLPGMAREGVPVDAAVPLLDRYFLLSPRESVAVLRSARSYQEAVWVADSDPSLAWLRLTSALETAALLWAGDASTPPERLRAWRPAIADVLASCGEDVVDAVATLLADITSSTHRFKEFCLLFLPPPPLMRPPEYFQLDWSRMRQHLGVVYDVRSKALHQSTPVPAPMCMQPMMQAGWDAPAETPWAAMETQGGRWIRGDAPMLFRTFEYIARGILLKWWGELEVRTGADRAGESQSGA